MLKKIALTGLFALAAALATAGTVAAKANTGKAGKVDVTSAPKGFCWPPGAPC
jgi:hypothetical protein